MINVAIMNSWILHRSTGREKVLLDFVLDVGRCLMTGDAQNSDEINRNVKLSNLRSIKYVDMPQDVRTDGYNHWPVQTDNKNAQRCKQPQCKRKTRFMCSKYMVYLCILGEKCFLNYHEAKIVP